MEIGKEISFNCLNLYPEFDNYKLMTEYDYNPELEKTNVEYSSGKLAYLYTMGSYLGGKVTSIGNTVSNKFVEWKIRDKVAVSGKKIFSIVKTTGGYVVEKSTPYVNRFAEQTNKGVSNLLFKTKDVSLNYLLSI